MPVPAAFSKFNGTIWYPASGPAGQTFAGKGELQRLRLAVLRDAAIELQRSGDFTGHRVVLYASGKAFANVNV